MGFKRLKIDTDSGAITPDLAIGDLCLAKEGNITFQLTVLGVGADFVDIQGDAPSTTLDQLDGMTVVRVGNNTDANRRAFIDLDAEGSNSPRIALYDNIDSFETFGNADTLKVLIGELSGVNDPNFPGLSGYGMYAQNVALKGTLLFSDGTNVETEIGNINEELVLKVAKDAVIASINISPETIRLNADRIEIDGTTVFSSGYDPSTKETPSGAQSKADTAESNAITTSGTNADTKISDFDATLGGLAKKSIVEKAELGTTVIVGGYIVTDLIDVDTLIVKTLKTANSGKRIEIDGGTNNFNLFNDVYKSFIINDDASSFNDGFTTATIITKNNGTQKGKTKIGAGVSSIYSGIEMTDAVWQGSVDKDVMLGFNEDYSQNPLFIPDYRTNSIIVQKGRMDWTKDIACQVLQMDRSGGSGTGQYMALKLINKQTTHNADRKQLVLHADGMVRINGMSSEPVIKSSTWSTSDTSPTKLYPDANCWLNTANSSNRYIELPSKDDVFEGTPIEIGTRNGASNLRVVATSDAPLIISSDSILTSGFYEITNSDNEWTRWRLIDNVWHMLNRWNG